MLGSCIQKLVVIYTGISNGLESCKNSPLSRVHPCAVCWMDAAVTGNELDGVSSLLQQHANTAKECVSIDSLRRRKTSSLLGTIVRPSDADKRSDSAVIPHKEE